MKYKYITPGGYKWAFWQKVLESPHTLIAGATGSGKSVLLNSVLFNALLDSPADRKLILIDLKRVELADYKQLPHTLYYADDPQSAVYAVRLAREIIERRFLEMQALSRPGKSVKEYTGAHIYVVIDEYADLITTVGKQVESDLVRISQIGRAARVHLIVCTQRPTREIITGRIKVNLDARIALRTATAQDSRNIIERSGAELLPRYGESLFLQYGYITRAQVPKTPESDMQARINYWLYNPQAVQLIPDAIPPAVPPAIPDGKKRKRKWFNIELPAINR